MGKRKKVNRKKFLSRILVLIIILVIIIVIFSSLFKKGNSEVIGSRLIIDNKDVTESLVSDIYLDKDGILYMSMEDVKNIFDKDLYFEESTKKIITTSDTKVAAIDVRSDKIDINSANLMLSTGVIDYGTTYYIPVSEMTKIYNIEVITSENSAIINSLYKELTTVKVNKKVSLKEKEGFFGGTIQKLEKDTEVILIGNAEKSGWIKVLTYEGNIGYIKEKNTSDKNQKRINMNNETFADKEPDINKSIELTKKTLTNENLRDFIERKKIIEDTISKAISKEKYTVYLNIEKTDVDSELLDRFIKELTPRLKEIGGSIARNWRKHVEIKIKYIKSCGGIMEEEKEELRQRGKHSDTEKGQGKAKKIILGAIIFIVLVVIGTVVWYNICLSGTGTAEEEVKIEIAMGSGTSKVANILKENGMIRSKEAFKLYVKLNNIKSLQAGNYTLTKDMTVPQIVEALKTGKVFKDNQVKITFVSGKNFRYIANEIAKNTNNTAEDVYQTLEDEEYINSLIEKYWFITDDIKNKDIYYALEGYLFPDTYFFEDKDVKVEDIFKTLLDKMDKVLVEYKEDIQKSKYSVHEILSIASIIENEGIFDKDRKDISSVLYNRLDKKMSLGSDVTTYYAFKIELGSRDLYKQEINTANPYNTRGPNMAGKIPVRTNLLSGKIFY